jgi:serine/threonine protein phosphatase 1
VSAPASDDESGEAEIAELLGGLMPRRHIEFLEATRTSFTCGDFFFVHAGVRPSVPINRQRDEDLMWIRKEFLEHEGPLEKFIVHGHTPVDQPDLRTNRINIDTGAYASGILSVIAIEGEQIALI